MKADKGAESADEETIEELEGDVKNNLYKVVSGGDLQEPSVHATGHPTVPVCARELVGTVGEGALLQGAHGAVDEPVPLTRWQPLG